MRECDKFERRCSECLEEYESHKDELILHGHVISNGAPATFRCTTCGDKAYWNNGDKVPSFWKWLIGKLRSD